MAFMMPVMKNDWDIYKSNRSRRTSETSGPRSRKISESKSESYGSRSPEVSSLGSPAHRSVPIIVGAPRAGRNVRPVRSLSCSPPAPAAPPAPPSEKFHTRLVDKLKRSLMRKNRTDSASGDDERSS